MIMRKNIETLSKIPKLNKQHRTIKAVRVVRISQSVSLRTFTTKTIGSLAFVCKGGIHTKLLRLVNQTRKLQFSINLLLQMKTRKRRESFRAGQKQLRPLLNLTTLFNICCLCNVCKLNQDLLLI